MDKGTAQELLKKIDEDRLFALLSYISILCVVPLLYKKDNDFVLSHGRQGLALFLCEFAVFIVTILLPILLKPFLFVFGLLAFVGVIAALQGKKIRLPFIYPLSEKLVL